MGINFWAVIVAALVPTIVGFVWYNPKVFGNAWMKAADMTDEKIKGGNMPLIFGLSFLFSLMLAFVMNFWTVHQFHLGSLLMDEPGFGDPASEVGQLMESLMGKYGNNYRTFGHGAVHGTLAGIFIALPILATNAMFERKGFKYVAVNAGYWILTLLLMCTIISGWV